MKMLERTVFSLILAGLAPAAAALPVVYDPGTLSFSTSAQDMWGSGGAALPARKEYSTGWSNSTTIGGIVGSEDEVIVEGIPATPAVTEKVWVPEWWEDHGYSQKHYKWGVIPYWDWHSRWEKHGGYYKTVTIVPAFPGTPALTADTRTGLEVELSSSGRVGLVSDLGFNGGSVDATVAFDASLNLPDRVGVGEFFSLAPDSRLVDGSIQARFPKLTGSVNAQLEARIDASSTKCMIGFGCSSEDVSLLDIGPTDIPLLEINTDNLPDKMSVFGLDDLAFDVTRGNVYLDMAVGVDRPPAPVLTLPGMTPTLGAGITLGQLTLDYPDLAVDGGEVRDGKLTASGRSEEVLRISADLDGLATLSGSGPLMGGVTYAGPLTFRGDLADVDLGPGMAIAQDFSLDPTLMVELAFDHPVTLEDGSETEFWRGVLDNLPLFALNDEHAVTVTPTFRVDALFSNDTRLDFDLSLSLDILKGSISALGIDLADFVLEEMDFPVQLGGVSVFDDSFSLGGFSSLVGTPFRLAANTMPSLLPRTGAVGVPEPGSVLLLAIGLAGLALGRRRAQSSAQRMAA